MRSLDCRSEVALSAKQEGKTTISCLPSYDPHRPAHRRAHQPLNQRGTPRAGTRPRQQCRPSPQGAEEEDAARGHLPRDETPRPLREPLREESSREGGSHPPRPQARPQEDAARGSAADEASGDPRGPRKRRPRAHPPASDLGTTVTNTLDKNLGLKTFFNGTVNSASIVEIHGKQDQGDAAEGRDVGEGGSRDPATRSFRRGGQGADP